MTELEKLRLAKMAKAYRANPALLIEEVLGASVQPWQADLLKAMAARKGRLAVITNPRPLGVIAGEGS